MRIKQAVDNGNVAALNQNEVQSHRNISNRSWLTSSNVNNRTICSNPHTTGNFTFNSNCNDSYRSETSEFSEINLFDASPVELEHDTSKGQLVCNRQYRLNTQNRNINFLKSCRSTTELANLEGATETLLASCESFLGVNPLESNASTGTSPIDEERAFDQSDTDEMSESGVHLVPRGIVNPNYPGFQHLAHTLQQDYSSNIENFYPSENDMTDDDVDIEITDITYEHEPNQNITGVECKNINNNNNNEDDKHTIPTPLKNGVFTQMKLVDSNTQNEIPDLLKTVSKNNNNFGSIDYDLNCTDTDIENNFQTNDIIGDFNKEIEDEIKKLLNYNINIQDDLEELRKDIKDTFTKPIENTINNISDVVNHVIKKLVETQSDDCDQCDDKVSETNLNKELEQISNIEKENETNTNTEMNLSRPTFLLIENNSNNRITDAFLSDGKDEIHIYDNEYDTEKMSSDVENTIKQLSTELRKIIPKLDEMRERDKLWNENKKEINFVVTDGNFNEIPSSSKCYNNILSETIHKIEGSSIHEDTTKMGPGKTQTEPMDIREQQRETSSAKNCSRSVHSNTSVRKNENAEEYELGSFDVYNIETALPKLDLDAIENHIKAAKEAERRKRNDREEIRRRLAMGAEAEEYYSMGQTDRPGKKPSLHSRLQNGMNLQICFMNETASDNESQASDLERNIISNNKNLSRSSIFSKSNYSLNNHPYQTRPLSVNITKHDKISTLQSGAKLRPSSLTQKSSKPRSTNSLGHIELKESDFYALQATLQTEARIALAQAKEMARIQMERERRNRPVSPVTEMLRRSMEKASAPLASDRRRVSRQLLTDMNIAQLQVIVNELHSQIETLNDSLVKLLMARDELHMGQDSMLVDIEDLTRYLGVKEQSKKTKGTSKSGVRRLTSLVHK